MMLSKFSLLRLIREVATNVATHVQDLRCFKSKFACTAPRLPKFCTRFQSTAIMALQEAAEAYLTTLFEVNILSLPCL